MNELLAIIIIVLICCAMFFAWLFSMATCPDRMVNIISGNTSSSPTSTLNESKELLESEVITKKKNKDNPPNIVYIQNGLKTSSAPTFAELNNEKRSNSKKLSVVPEADEQLTITSISQSTRQPLLTLLNLPSQTSIVIEPELPEQLDLGRLKDRRLSGSAPEVTCNGSGITSII